MHIMTTEVPRRRRCEHSPTLKRELVARSLVPGASVAAIALEAGINANLLFTWRRAHLRAMKATAPAAQALLLPVEIQSAQVPPVASPGRATADGAIEVEFNGARVRLRGMPDEAALRCVLQALRALA
jgi:transposase